MLNMTYRTLFRFAQCKGLAHNHSFQTSHIAFLRRNFEVAVDNSVEIVSIDKE